MEDLHMPAKKRIETRSNTRNHVFNLVFQLEFFDIEEKNEILNKYYEILEAEIALETRKDDTFVPLEINKKIIEKQFLGIIDNLDEINEKIKQNSQGWDIERIDKVDLAILRLAIYEMLF